MRGSVGGRRNAADFDAAADRVTRGSRHGGDDGDFVADELVEQARLAHVGLPDQHDAEAFAQQASLARAPDNVGESLAQAREPAGSVGGPHEVDVFFGEIQRRLGERPQLDERVDGRGDLARERSGQTARGCACSGRRCRFDQIGHAFRLGKIELAVEKRALGEFARLGEPRAEIEATIQEQ